MTNKKMQVVDLPVSATEDRVVGSLNIEHAIKKGEKKFEDGILAQANRNILYVDEVNLLDDHVVDVLLDSAAMGTNTIEREGVSFSHPAHFILVGTMNPEEGDLRPQLLDRFGLAVDIRGESNPEERTEIVRRRMEFENRPQEFYHQFAEQQQELKAKVLAAGKRIMDVQIKDEMLELVAKIAIEIGVDGHRADINIIKTAATNAAFLGRQEVKAEDISEAAAMVLPHRVRRKPFEDKKLELSQVAEIISNYQKRGMADAG